MPKKVKKKVVVNRYKCAYCGACISVCKYNANELIETFLLIYEDRCTGCGVCAKVCPMGALEVIKCTT
jgi:NAD-dependent dihydropyrimidine dehydrogenase PreA subunit